MANKLDMQAAIRYLTLGAGAVVVPALLMKVEMLSGILSNQILAFDIGGFATVGGIVLAAVGVGIADMLTGR